MWVFWNVNLIRVLILFFLGKVYKLGGDEERKMYLKFYFF